jgi:hypothetical protein
MDTQILLASEAEGLPRGPLHRPRGHRSLVTSHGSPVTLRKLFCFTLLSKNASANHLVSHSCKNKGLKVPCFHTLTKNIRGVGGERGLRVPIPSGRGPAHEQIAARELKVANQHSLFVSRLTSTPTKNASATPLTSTLTKTKDLKSFIINTYKKGVGGPNHESLITNHESLPLTPLDSALTSKRASKSFTSNTCEKQGGGGPSFEFRVSSFGFRSPQSGILIRGD